jgi:uncharacterized protein YbcI
MSQQIAEAVSAFQQRSTGHMPKSVAIAMSDETVVATLQDALSPAERALAKSAAGAVQMQDFHRQLFINSCDPLLADIKRITGVAVREATAEIETMTGAVMQVFATGTVVQVFLLSGRIPTEQWSGSGSNRHS